MLCTCFKWFISDQDTGMLTHFLFLRCQTSEGGKNPAKIIGLFKSENKKKHKMASGTGIKLGGGIQRSGEAVDAGT